MSDLRHDGRDRRYWLTFQDPHDSSAELWRLRMSDHFLHKAVGVGFADKVAFYENKADGRGRQGVVALAKVSGEGRSSEDATAAGRPWEWPTAGADEDGFVPRGELAEIVGGASRLRVPGGLVELTAGQWEALGEAFGRNGQRRRAVPVVGPFYLAVVLPTEDGEWSAWVPDLPDCRARGETADAARSLVERAASERVLELRRSGRPVPPPRSTAHPVTTA